MPSSRRAVLAAGLAAPVLAPRFARAAMDPAPDVSTFVEPTLAPLIAELGRRFRRMTGAPIRLFAAPSPMLIREIPFTQADLLIVQGAPFLADAVAAKVAMPSGNVPLGRNGLAVLRRGDGPALALPQLDTGGTLAIVDADVPDPLGAATRSSLQKLAWPPASMKVQGVARDADVLYLLRTDAARLGVAYRTDARPGAGFSTAAMLPPPATPLDCTAALTTKAVSRNAAPFLAFLGTPDSVAYLRSCGLEDASS